jgi:hypothetical protein
MSNSNFRKSEPQRHVRARARCRGRDAPRIVAYSTAATVEKYLNLFFKRAQEQFDVLVRQKNLWVSSGSGSLPSE